MSSTLTALELDLEPNPVTELHLKLMSVQILTHLDLQPILSTQTLKYDFTLFLNLTTALAFPWCLDLYETWLKLKSDT
jgi:hypothetical protein